jgi:hypothetical protein
MPVTTAAITGRGVSGSTTSPVRCPSADTTRATTTARPLSSPSPMKVSRIQ